MNAQLAKNVETKTDSEEVKAPIILMLNMPTTDISIAFFSLQTNQ